VARVEVLATAEGDQIGILTTNSPFDDIIAKILPFTFKAARTEALSAAMGDVAISRERFDTPGKPGVDLPRFRAGSCLSLQPYLTLNFVHE
jgi:hypothetical protein